MVVLSICRAGISLAILLTTACSFDTSTLGRLTIDSGSSLTGRADAIPPELCPDDIHIELQVEGVTESAAPTEPFVHTLIGDTVKLSAIGTCTRAGPIQYNWVVESATSPISETARPNRSSETISVYSAEPGEYAVMLYVSDGSQTESKGVYAFEAHGFEEITSYDGNTIRDLSAGADYLWVGADDGAYRGGLASPFAAYPAVNDLYAGATLPDKTRLHETASGAHVWFGTNNSDGEVRRLTVATGLFSTHDTIAMAKTNAIRSNAAGVRVATDDGVVFSPDSNMFVMERDESSDALALGATGLWAGNQRLYPLPVGAPSTVFDGSQDQRIQGLADDGTQLWVGGNGKGIARVLNGVAQEVYRTPTLTHNDVKSLAIDATGDVWAATKGGVSRFKVDRQKWIKMTADSGLDGIDLEVIEVDERSQRRAIYTGGGSTLSVMRIP